MEVGAPLSGVGRLGAPTLWPESAERPTVTCDGVGRYIVPCNTL